MSTNEFDELVKSKFDQNDFAYNAEHWDRLSRQLSVLEKRKPAIIVSWWKVASIAASVALITTVTAYILKTNVVTKHANIAEAHVNTPAKQVTPVDQPTIQNQPTIQQPSQQEPADNVAIAQSNTPSRSGAKSLKQNNINTGFKSPIIRQNNNRVAQQNNNIVVAQAVPPVNATLPVSKGNTNNNAPFTMPQPKSSQEQPRNPNVAYNLDLTPDYSKEEKYEEVKKLILSVAGGVHYVSSSPGYMAGANVRKKLNDKFYLEADVAFLSNNNSQTITTTTTIPAANNSSSISSNLQTGFASGTPGTAVPSALKSSGPSQPSTPSQSGTNFNSSTSKHAATTTKTSSKKNLYNFNYLQVAPQAGYNVSHRLSVGVGADVEQLLQNNQSSADIASGQVKAAPDMNVGMIGKTEYSLTGRLKAGVLYRGDVNGIFTKNSKYVNQSFVQFQLKFAIFNK